MKTILALLLLLAATAALAACGDDDDGDATPTPSQANASAGTATPGDGSPTAEPTRTRTSCPTNPDPADVSEVAIAAPRTDAVVTSPANVEGVAAAFEATIQIDLVDGDGNEIASVTGMTEEGQTLSPFRESVEFEISENTPGCVRVYMLSAEDGSPVSVAQVPVTLAP